MIQLNQAWMALSAGQRFSDPCFRPEDLTGSDAELAAYGELISSEAFSCWARKGEVTLFRADPVFRDFISDISKLRGTGSPLRTAFRIEALIQLIIQSGFRDLLLDRDPANLYERAPLGFPPPGLHVSTLPTGTAFLPWNTMALREENDQGAIPFLVTVTPGSSTLTVNGATAAYSMPGSTSTPIEVLPGRGLRLTGAAPVDPFSFAVILIGRMTIPYPLFCTRHLGRAYIWPQELQTAQEAWQTSPMWHEKLAAVTLLAIYSQLKDSPE